MAGGVGTGLFLLGKCGTCRFDEAEEIDWQGNAPIDHDIEEAKNVAR